ncbi:hypothetical protein [Polyangium mundeleinium]|uniref:Annexin n=1 Tax=Polyangium mundeleinium TaxID=2995306 RepID=A0ABT5F455_9BACT|nr:hypothetical protein [Polyangium mundeleinium]MDC0747850.1 hypothetical protein [Polyangium mundeleinium]
MPPQFAQSPTTTEKSAAASPRSKSAEPSGKAGLPAYLNKHVEDPAKQKERERLEELDAAVTSAEWRACAGDLMVWDADQLPPGPSPKDFRSAAYNLKWKGVTGDAPLAAFLEALPPERASHKEALAAATKDHAADIKYVMTLDQAIAQFTSGGSAANASSAFLGAYLPISPDGRRNMQADPSRLNALRSFTPKATRSETADIREAARVAMLQKLEAPVAPANGAPESERKEREEIEAAYNELRKKIDAALGKAPPSKKRAERKLEEKQLATIKELIQRAKPKVRDRLYADASLMAKLRQYTSATQMDGLVAELDQTSAVIDRIMQARMATAGSPDKAVIDALASYCTEHSGETGRAARDRLMRDQRFHAALRPPISTPARRRALRLVESGIDEPTPLDGVHAAVAASNSVDLGAALAKLLSDRETLLELRFDLKFHHAMLSFEGTVTVDGLAARPYDLCLQAWGLSGSFKLPGSPDAQVQENVSDNADPPSQKELDELYEKVFYPKIDELYAQLDTWTYVSDSNVLGILHGFQAEVAKEPHVTIVRRGKIASGPKFLELYEQKHGAGLRAKINAGIDAGANLAECERVLGIRSDSAATDAAQSKDELPGPRKTAGLEQALREVLADDRPVTFWIHKCAQKIYDEVNEFSYADLSDIQAAFDELKSHVTEAKLKEVGDLTGKGPPNLYVLHEAAYQELGGSLTVDLTKRTTLEERAGALAAVGMNQEAIDQRKYGDDTTAQRRAMLEAARKKAAGELFSLLVRSNGYNLPAIGQKYAEARAPKPENLPPNKEGDADPDAAAELEKFYRAEYGITVAHHFVLTAERVANDPYLSQGKKKEQILTEMGGPVEGAPIEVAADELAIKDRFSVSPEFSEETAEQIASEIQAELKQPFPRAQIIGDKLAGYLPEEQRLIQAHFRKVSGGLDIRFFVQSHQAKRVPQGQGGLQGSRAEVERLLDLTEKGKSSFAVKLRIFAEAGDVDAIFRTIESAKPEDRSAALADGRTMAALRGAGRDVEWNRIYKGLKNQADIVDIMESRAHGKGGVSGLFSFTHEEGMRNDIRAYMRRRKAALVKEVEADEAFQKRSKEEKGAEIMRRMREECLRTFADSNLRAIIDGELSGAEMSEIQSMILHGGEAAPEDLVLTGSDWSDADGAILPKLRTLSDADRARLRKDPEFLTKLGDMLDDPSEMRQAMNILYGTTAENPAEGGEDHLSALEAKSRPYPTYYAGQGGKPAGKTSPDARGAPRRADAQEILDHLVQLSPEQLRALLVDASLVEQVRKACGHDAARLEMIERILDFDIESTGAPDPIAGANDAMAKAKARLRVIEHQAKTGLAAASMMSWNATLRQAQAVYRTECKIEQKDGKKPAGEQKTEETTPAAPSTKTDGKKKEKTYGDDDLFAKVGTTSKEENTAARKGVWQDVEVDVRANLAKSGRGTPSDVNAGDLIGRAVLGEEDPTDAYFKEQLGIDDDEEGMLAAVRGASSEHLIHEWTSVTRAKPPPGGSAEDTLQAKYDAWVAARKEEETAEEKEAEKNKPKGPEASTPPTSDEVRQPNDTSAAAKAAEGPKGPDGNAAPQPAPAESVPAVNEKAAPEPEPKKPLEPYHTRTLVARAVFAGHVIDVSKSFDDLVLKHTGGAFADDADYTAEDRKKRRARDNKEYTDLRKLVRDRIPGLPAAIIASAIGAPQGANDAEQSAELALIQGPTRAATTQFEFFQDDYKLQRTRDGTSDAGFDLQASFGVSGGSLDIANEEYRAALRKARVTQKEKGELYGDVTETEAEEEIAPAAERAKEALQEFRQAKAKVANIAATVVSTLVAAVVTVLTAGAAGPLMVALAGALIGASSAAAGALVHEAIEGSDYELGNEGLKSIATDAVMGAVTALGGYWARSAIARIAETRKMAGALSAIQKSIKEMPPATRFLIEAAEQGVYGAADTALNGLTGSAAALLNPFDLVKHGLNEGWQRNMKAAKERLASVPGEAWHAFVTGALQHSLSQGAGKLGERARKKLKLPEKAHPPPAPVPAGKPGDVNRFVAAASPKGKAARAQAIAMMRGNVEQAPLQALVELMTSEETYRSSGNIGDRYLEHLGGGLSQGIKDTWMFHHRERLLATRRVKRADELLTKRGLKPEEGKGDTGSPYRTNPKDDAGGPRMTPAEHESYMMHALRGQRNAEALPGRAEDLAVADPEIWLRQHRADVAERHEGVIARARESYEKAREEGRKETVEEHLDALAVQEYQALVQARHGEPGVSFEDFADAIHDAYRRQKQDRGEERVRDAEKRLENHPDLMTDAERVAYLEHVRRDEDLDFAHWSGNAAVPKPEAWLRKHQKEVIDRVDKAIAEAEARAKKARDEGQIEQTSLERMALEVYRALAHANHGVAGVDPASLLAYMKARGARHATRNEHERRLAHGLAPGSVEALVKMGADALVAAGIKGTVEIYVTGAGAVKPGKPPPIQELTFEHGDTLEVVIVVKPDPSAPKPTPEQMAFVAQAMSAVEVQGRKHVEKPQDIRPGDRFTKTAVKARAVAEPEFYAETTKKGAPNEPLALGEKGAPRAPFRIDGVSPQYRPPLASAKGHGELTPREIYDKHGPLRTPEQALKAMKEVKNWADLKAAFKNDPASAQAIVDAREMWVDATLKALAKKYGVELRAVGSTTLVSDYDLQLFAKHLVAEAADAGKQHNVAKVVEEWNNEARKVFGAESGTALDTNVYDYGETMHRAAGYAPDFSSNDTQVRHENDRLQDIMSLAKVRRYIGSDVQEKGLSRKEAQKRAEEAWNEYTKKELELAPPEMRSEIAARMKEAQKRFLDAEAKIDARAAKIEADAKADGSEHAGAADVRLRAANELYAEALGKVDAWRRERDAALEALAKDPNNDELRRAVDKLTLRIRTQMAVAALYANEVYNSEGAVLHVVGGQAGEGKTLSDAHMIQSMREQFGDALKDLSPDHYGSEPDRAAVQTSKYLGRYLESLRHLEIPKLLDGAAGTLGPGRVAELKAIIAALEAIHGLKSMRSDPTTFDEAAIEAALRKQPMKELVGPDGKLDVAALRRVLIDLTQAATALARGKAAQKAPPTGMENEGTGGTYGKDVYEGKGSVNNDKLTDWAKKTAQSGRELVHKSQIVDAPDGLKLAVPHPDDSSKTILVEVTLEAVAVLPPGPHEENGVDESGPGRVIVKYEGGKWTAHVLVRRRLHPNQEVPHVLVHELSEVADIVYKHPEASKETIRKEQQAKVWKKGSTETDMTAHDRAAVEELVSLHDGIPKKEQNIETIRGSLDANEQLLAADRVELDRLKKTPGADTAKIQELENKIQSREKGIASQKNTLKEKEDELRPLVARRGRMLEAMGLRDPADLPKKLELLRKAGVPDELVERIHDDLALPVQQREAEAAYRRYEAGPRSQAGTVSLDAHVMQHLMYPRDLHKTEELWTERGLSGGHDDKRVKEWLAHRPEIELVHIKSKTLPDGTGVHLYEQYRWKGPGEVPTKPDERPGGSMCDMSKWMKADQPKTTADDPAAVLRLAEDALVAWHASVKPKDDNDRFGRDKDGKGTAATKDGVELGGYYEAVPPNAPATAYQFVLITVYLDARWF